MILPNYKGGSVVNLMSSIAGAFGVKLPYNKIKNLRITKKKVILLLIDGLGYEWLKTYSPESVFLKYCKKPITSVFPSTTGACIPTFIYGSAPKQHGLTGWYVHMKEVGGVSTPLPFIPRGGVCPYDVQGVTPQQLFDEEPLFNKLKATSYYLLQKNLMNSPTNQAFLGKATPLVYTSLRGLFRQLRTVSKKRGPLFCHAYWPGFDHVCHRQGVSSLFARAHVKTLEKKFIALVNYCKRKDILFIVTADHGMMKTPKNKAIHIKKHPQLEECLTLPLCGDRRTAYCYVHTHKKKQFETYVKKKLSHACALYPSHKLVKKEAFGLFKANKKFLERIGDYVLIMKEDYTIHDSLINEGEHYLPADHGGTSAEEMFVPLCVVDPKEF